MLKISSLALALALFSNSSFAETSTGGLTPKIPMTKYGMPMPAQASKKSALTLGEYFPDEATQEALNKVSVYAEIYPVLNTEVEPALAKALAGEPPAPVALGLIMPQELHFNMSGVDYRFTEVRISTLRNHKDVDYSDNCGVFPMPGDMLEAVYQGDDPSITIRITGSVVRHIPMNDQGTPVDPSNPLVCGSEAMSRTFYSGAMVIQKDNAPVHHVPMLLQNVVEPH